MGSSWWLKTVIDEHQNTVEAFALQFFFSWKLYFFLSDRSILVFTAYCSKNSLSPDELKTRPLRTARASAATARSVSTHSLTFVCCLLTDVFILLAKVVPTMLQKCLGRSLQEKWFCRGKQFVSALCSKESTSVFSSPTEWVQKAPLKGIYTFLLSTCMFIWGIAHPDKLRIKWGC